MAEIEEIRAGLKANLDTLSDCTASAYQRTNPQTPGLYVVGPAVDYDVSPGSARMTFIVRGLVSASSDEGGQKRLDKWKATAGSDSVKAAIEADKSLGGACDDLRVSSISADQLFVFETIELLGAEWSVTVIT